MIASNEVIPYLHAIRGEDPKSEVNDSEETLVLQWVSQVLRQYLRATRQDDLLKCAHSIRIDRSSTKNARET